MLARRTLVLSAFLLALSAVTAVPARSQEVHVGHGISTTRNLTSWRDYFAGDMRELVTQSESTTTYAEADNPPVRVAGVDLDLGATSPVRSTIVSRYVVSPSAPDFGLVRVTARSTIAGGSTDERSFSFMLRQPAPPIAIGPVQGQEIDVPASERVIGGTTLRIRSVSRTTAIEGLLIAPTIEDLIAGKAIGEVREPGTRLVPGSMRVVNAAGELLGYYAGDIRVAVTDHYATAP